MSRLMHTLMILCTILVAGLSVLPTAQAQLFNDPNPNYRAVSKGNNYFSYGQTTTVQPIVSVDQVALNSVYAFFALIILFAIIAGIVWGCVSCCCRETHKRKRHHKH